MNWDEHIALIRHAATKFGDKLAIIGNTGSNSTRENLRGTRAGFEAGMHASLQINPYYGKTSENGLKTHIWSAMNYGPAIVYNVPSRTAQDISPQMVNYFAEHPNFCGMKECTGHERIKQYQDQGILCWSGNDDEYHESKWGGYNCHGVISVTSNVLPGVMRQLTDGENPELAKKVEPFMNWLFTEPNPIALNTVMAMTGQSMPVFRSPYFPYKKELRS